MTTQMDRTVERFRAQQAAIAARAALRVGSYWRGVEVGNEDSEANFVRLAIPAISSGFMEGMESSRMFTFDRLSVMPEPIMPNEEQIAASLSYVGPVVARRAMYAGEDFQVTPQQARKHVERQVRGAAVRLTAEGGRKVARSVQSERIGWMRVTKGENPCFFCVALASRGPVYDDDSFDMSDPRFTGPGEVKVHDSCACALIAVTEADAAQITQLREYEDLWSELSGKDVRDTDSTALVTFRRNYEQRQRDLGRAA